MNGTAKRWRSRFPPTRPGFESDRWKKSNPPFSENLPFYNWLGDSALGESEKKSEEEVNLHSSNEFLFTISAPDFLDLRLIQTLIRLNDLPKIRLSDIDRGLSAQAIIMSGILVDWGCFIVGTRVLIQWKRVGSIILALPLHFKVVGSMPGMTISTGKTG